MRFEIDRFSLTRAPKKRLLARRIAAMIFGDFLAADVGADWAHVVSLTGPNLAAHCDEWRLVLGKTGLLWIAERNRRIMRAIKDALPTVSKIGAVESEFWCAADMAADDLGCNHSHAWKGAKDWAGLDYGRRRPNALILDYDACSQIGTIWRPESEGGDGFEEKLSSFAAKSFRISGPIWIVFTCSAREGLTRFLNDDGSQDKSKTRVAQITKVWNRHSKWHHIGPPLLSDHGYHGMESGGAPMCCLVLRADRTWSKP